VDKKIVSVGRIPDWARIVKEEDNPIYEFILGDDNSCLCALQFSGPITEDDIDRLCRSAKMTLRNKEDNYFDTMNAKFNLTIQWKDRKDLTDEQYKEMLKIQKEMKLNED